MKVSEQDVSYVAELAHVELTGAERERMRRDLNAILEFVGRLAALDTAGVEPMAQVASGAAPAMRHDQARPALPRTEVISNAPESDGAYFKVPRVIEK